MTIHLLTLNKWNVDNSQALIIDLVYQNYFYEKVSPPRCSNCQCLFYKPVESPNKW